MLIFFTSSHSNRSVIGSQNVLICISQMVNDVLYLFMCLFTFPSDEVSVQFLHSFSNWIIYFLIVECNHLFIYSRYEFFVRYKICKHFLLVCGLPLHSLNRNFHRAEDFNFDKIKFINFFYALCFLYHL